MKFISTALFCALLACGVFGQEKPQPDRWRGLILGETTPTQAIEALGKPDEDKLERLRAYGIEDRVLTPKIKEKNARQLSWKKLDGLKLARLSFREDKLVIVYLWLAKEKEFAAASLETIYGIPFAPKISTLSELSGDTLGAAPLSNRKNVSYPSVYTLIAQSPNAWVSATVGNTGMGHILFGDGDTSRSTGSYPGKVGSVQLISRTLENREGGDVLK